MTLTKQRTRRPTATHRKVQGGHHKRDQHYIKAYWPYLPVFAVLLLGIIGNVFLNRTNHNVLGYSTSISSTALLTDTNSARSNKHESALELNPQLTAAAQAKANDMAKRNYWSHVTPDGTQPWSFMQAAGYDYDAAGENLAYGFGTSDQVIAAWMASAEHRANILNGDYRDVGFAAANAVNYNGQGHETIIVALYGEPTNLNNLATATAPMLSTAAPTTLSRSQIISSATWVQLALAAVCGAAIMLFFVRHTFAWHKVLVRGEQFAVRHPFFDTFLISLVVFVFLLSHAAGSIL